MKVCFFLQRRFAYVGHAMITLLKERYEVNEFCGYVNVRSSYDFLCSQKEISYTKLLLEEDVYDSYKNETVDVAYLDWLEKEYGLPNLWPYLKMDRVLSSSLLLRSYPYDEPLFGHEDQLKILQATARAIIKFLDEEKPDFIFFSVVSNLSSMLLYHIAKKRGIQTLVLYVLRLGKRYAMSDGYDTFFDLESTWQRLLAGSDALKDREEMARATTWLHDYQNHPTVYMARSAAAGNYLNPLAKRWAQFQFLKPRNMLHSLSWLWLSFSSYFKNPHRNDYLTIKPWHEIIDKIKIKYRSLIGTKGLFERPVAGEVFAFFALHVEPEAYPMLVAPFYIDQLWLVKQTARSLPVNAKLYVKDHPAMVANRPRSFYKELAKIPNVRVIDPFISSFNLIQESFLTFTITGTAAWEAILLKKPVIIFGDVFFSKLTMVKVCRNITDLPDLIKEQRTNFSYQETELIAFVAALFRESVELDLVQLWYMEGGSQVLNKKKSDLVPFIDLLAGKLGLKLPDATVR